MSNVESHARPTIAIAVAGCAARAVLDAHAAGRVLAVFRRSFYVAFDGDVVCLGSPQLGLGPLNLLCARRDDLAWADDGIEAGAAVTCTQATLDVASRLQFDFGAADVWRPPLAPVSSPAAVAMGLELVARSARLRGPGGLGALLATSTPDPAGAAYGRDDPLLRAALPTVCALRDWLAAALAGASSPPPALAALIGLGPGLTPSGDDFLGGAMIALHHFGRQDVAQRLAATVVPAADRETSLISAAYLRCAARGEGSQVLFDALACVAAGDGTTLEGRLDAIDAVGHTSGWDCLAGAALACRALQARMRSTSTATSAACAFDGATTMPASSSSATCRE